MPLLKIDGRVLQETATVIVEYLYVYVVVLIIERLGHKKLVGLVVISRKHGQVLPSKCVPFLGGTVHFLKRVAASTKRWVKIKWFYILYVPSF